MSEPPICLHPATEPRKRTKSNGVEVVSLQCVTYGRSLRELPKANHNLATLKDFDPQLIDLWDETQALAFTKIREEKSEQWWVDYTAYLTSDHWRKVRALVLNRDRLCQVCFAAPSVQAHHLSYESFKRWGVSFAVECVGVCVTCHERLHNGTP